MLKPAHNVQSQMQQNADSSTSEAYPSPGTSQFNIPTAPPHNLQPGMQRTQPRYPAGPGVLPSHATSQFNVLPTTPMPGTQAAWVDPHIQNQVKYYADWLVKQAKYDVLNDNSQEINDYIQEAIKVVKVGKNEVAMFAPFRAKLSALQTFTTRQVVALCVIGLLWMIGLLVFRLEMLTAVIAAITVFYSVSLILSASMAIRTFQNPAEEHISDDVVHALNNTDWPTYTILCPLYREAQVVPQFVQAMLALDYPAEKLQILFLTEEDDSETRNAIRALSLPAHFKIVVVPDGKPRTKPRACNYGLMQATGSYVVIYDAEDIPDPLQLKKAVLTFANHETNVVCVQAKLNFYNIRQNLLTRWFTAEYSAWFDVILPGLQLAKFSLPLGGTSNHFRAAALRALGGWDAYNVTEDCDLGLRLKRYGMNTVILDSTTLEEANSQLKNWIRQRSRWIKGYMQTYLVHMRHPLEDFQKGRLYDLFSFQMVIGSGTGVMFLNPFLWVLLGIYIVFGPSVVNIYHVLFPGPILYLGTLCLAFGNFYYVYLYLLACMKRKHYHLLPWTLFIPCYWLLMTVAAFYALFELLVKPHYWQKTVHGLHLKGQLASPVVPSRLGIPTVAEEPTMPVPVMPGKVSKVGTIPSVTMSLKAIPTLLMPAVSLKQKQAQLSAKKAKVRDLWLVATVIIACITSITACWYYFQQHEITLYNDALSHMRIARSVFDSATPGLAQLGADWLPLPHTLMWPFVWNDYLWHTGLAGSFVSMPCYVITAVYVFLSARRLTKRSGAAFIGALAFILNPTVLYLQSTPLSETVCMAILVMSIYYFLCWIQEGRLRFLVLTAASTFLATLARYDGWALFAALLVLIPLIDMLKRRSVSHIAGDSILFLALGGLGVVLWLLWNEMIFGNPLYFKDNIYSSQSQQTQLLQAGYLFSYHNPWQSFLYYSVDAEQSGGIILCLLAIIGLLWFIWRHRRSVESLAILIFLVPFAFYVASLYTGQAAIWIAGANPPGTPIPFYNVRYGAQIVGPMAVLLVLPIGRWSAISWKRVRSLVQCLLFLAIIVQYFVLSYQGIVVLKDTIDTSTCSLSSGASLYLAQHYNGGYILEDIFTTQADPTTMNVDFKDIIWEGSNTLWIKALHDPAVTVDWIFVKPTNSGDVVAQHINVHSPSFLANFTLVVRQPNGIELYHRRGQPLIPLHPAPTEWNVPLEGVTCPLD